MGFDEAKRLLKESLENMNFRIYKERPQIADKNKLHTGDVDVEFVLDKIKKCNGDDHRGKPGFADADDNKSHRFIKNGWYIKYFLKDGIVNIVSVHKEEHHD